jgi:hypothetical protein
VALDHTSRRRVAACSLQDHCDEKYKCQQHQDNRHRRIPPPPTEMHVSTLNTRPFAGMAKPFRNRGLPRSPKLSFWRIYVVNESAISENVRLIYPSGTFPESNDSCICAELGGACEYRSTPTGARDLPVAIVPLRKAPMKKSMDRTVSSQIAYR